MMESIVFSYEQKQRNVVFKCAFCRFVFAVFLLPEKSAHLVFFCRYSAVRSEERVFRAAESRPELFLCNRDDQPCCCDPFAASGYPYLLHLAYVPFFIPFSVPHDFLFPSVFFYGSGPQRFAL